MRRRTRSEGTGEAEPLGWRRVSVRIGVAVLAFAVLFALEAWGGEKSDFGGWWAPLALTILLPLAFMVVATIWLLQIYRRGRPSGGTWLMAPLWPIVFGLAFLVPDGYSALVLRTEGITVRAEVLSRATSGKASCSVELIRADGSPIRGGYHGGILPYRTLACDLAKGDRVTVAVDPQERVTPRPLGELGIWPAVVVAVLFGLLVLNLAALGVHGERATRAERAAARRRQANETPFTRRNSR